MRALALTLLVAACTPDRGSAYQLAMAQGMRSTGAGRDEEAARAFEHAAATAKLPNDAAFARQEAALAWLRAGQEQRGLGQLQTLAHDKTTYSVNAEYKFAEYKYQKKDPDAVPLLEAFLVAHPQTGYARTAFVKVLRSKDDAKESVTWLATTRAKVAGSDLEQRFAYEHAKRVEGSDQKPAALAEYRAIADRWPYPKGVHWDDALVRAAAIEKDAGRPREAIALLERLLSKREKAWSMGSYEKVAYAASAMEIARIYEGPLNDRAAARKAYHRAYADFPTALTRDDALWKEAELWQADGDGESRCKALRTLVHDFPDSRYVPCATAACDVPRPKKSDAPARCHEYLARPR